MEQRISDIEATYASKMKDGNEIHLGFTEAANKNNTIIVISSEQAVDVCHHIVYVMGVWSFIKQCFYNKFRR